MTQLLAYTEIQIDKTTSLETILVTPDYAESGYIVEVDLQSPNKMKNKKSSTLSRI